VINRRPSNEETKSKLRTDIGYTGARWSTPSAVVRLGIWRDNWAYSRIYSMITLKIT